MLARGFGRHAGAGGGRRGTATTALALATALIVAACSSSATSPVIYVTPSPVPTATPTSTAAPTAGPVSYPPGQVVAYEVIEGKARPVKPAPDAGAAAGARVNGFAFDLLGRLDAKGNLVYSPTSIALALAMVRSGAKGNTAAQMDKVLHQFGASGQEAEIAALLAQLRQTFYIDQNGEPLEPGATPNPAAPDPVMQLTVANQLFSQKGMTVQPAYLDALSSTYGAGLGQLDFASDPESARLTINKWAADNTKNRIKDVLQPGDVQPATRIALANAIYLKSNWFTKFDPKDTKPGTFTTGSGAKVSVPMMSLRMHYMYGAGSGYRAIKVPLEAMSSLEMVFIVPDNMATFQAGLTDSKFQAILASTKVYDVSFWLPKYSVRSRVEVADVLSAMGMSDLFNANAADLSGITTDEKLYIDKVIHQANMDVDEEGVTAAAVTVALGLGGAGEPPPHVDFKVDRSFLYFIRDQTSGAILFMGRVDDPTAA